MSTVLIAAVAFVGTHFLLSHPLRGPIVARVGEKAFLGLYSLVAFATLGWLVMAYRYESVTNMVWSVGDGLWALASAIMLLAAILLMGSFVGNPAMPDPEGQMGAPAEAKGVFAITRHPMMWSFALWSVSHILVYPVAKNIIVALAILILALVGAALQDRKKEALQPEMWRQWEARTSYWPFAAIAAGRARFGRFGIHALAGGLVVWLVATWAHMPLAGWDAGIWRWIG
ncbi:NnrU family protein [Sphingobium sp. HBC34]|uniref:NnrU family protein n=1 Tax=Sphingobium cyanobacteriorum TaxID=3063954 RepID=A0ABT8ZJA6_9SPHN|nr:NnrU family protein [Sphingobium sp. HBC34]MDO7834598.1 NnrU family protein [Sphingobium sp. HBC34]